jgi:hypothetical protein
VEGPAPIGIGTYPTVSTIVRVADVGRRSLIIQWVLLSLVFSAILAVLTYYGAPSAIFRNRVVAGVWGFLFGIPGAAAFVMKMNPSNSDQ